jgi:protein required for attachment to host cells
MARFSRFPTTWVLVADAARARIFEWLSPLSDIVEVTDLVNPEGRLREGMLTSDRPGRVFDSHGHDSGHPMRSAHSAKDNAASTFAKQINDQLATALRDGKYERLVLVAPPEFLGRLRSQLDDQVSKKVIECVGLDLTKAKADAIKSRLPVLSSLA